MSKTLFSYVALCVALVGIAAKPAQAALTTSPYLFTEQAGASTGQFEWDEFSGSVFGSFAPDVASTGTGGGSVSLDFTPQPFDGPPVSLVTSTQNIYTGGTLADFDIDLTGLSTAEANTTVVLQLSVLGTFDPASIQLDGSAPTTFVDRGVAQDVLHNTDDGSGGAPFDTRFYWFEWQVAADADYLLEFSNPTTHTSFTQARVDYFNTATAFSAVAATAVPEPTSLALVGMSSCAMLALRRRR